MTARSLVATCSVALLTMAGLVLPASPAQAAVTVLDFDYGPADTPCSYGEGNPLREEYAGFGIHFRGPNATDGGLIQNTCSIWGVQPHSGSRFILFSKSGVMANGGTPRWPETIKFDSPKRIVQIYVSQAGFNIGDAHFTMIGKSGKQTIRKATVTTSTSDWVRLRVRARSGFSRVILRASDPDDGWLADDLGVENK